jgi:regulatory protein
VEAGLAPEERPPDAASCGFKPAVKGAQRVRAGLRGVAWNGPSWHGCAMAQDRSKGTEAGRPSRARPAPQPAGAAPDEKRLQEAALAHLARFAATEAALRRVLQRRVDRWARAAIAEGAPQESVAAEAAASRQAAVRVAQRMVAAGAVDDAAFAESRARRLARAGRSRRAIAAHLAAKGVDAGTARAALPEDPEDAARAELAAAIAWCRRRRLGPFGPADPPPEARQKALAALARGGFPRDIATRALDMDPEAAETLLLQSRRS